jgi:DNA-binding transcriptional LysR family regulator
LPRAGLHRKNPSLHTIAEFCVERAGTSLEDLEIFYHIVNAGSLSAAGREMGLSPAVICRRLQNLENRLGVRLLQRTTRRLTRTEVGTGYYEHVAAVLAAVDEADAFVRDRSVVVRGSLKVSVPTTFGRLHVAPRLKEFLDRYPDITLEIDLTDKFTDVVAEGFDLAIRISDMAGCPLAARKLSPNHRVICAAPEYLKKHGIPRDLDALKNHRVLSSSNHTAWSLEGPEGALTYRPQSFIDTNSSDLVREGTLAGLGVALRSTWDVGPELKRGQLRRILKQYRGSPETAIYAVYPSSRQVPAKVRAFVDHFARIFGPEPYWDKGLAL